MNKIFPAFCLLFFLASCSPEEDPTPEVIPATLNVDVTPSTLNLEVDEIATVQVQSDNPLQEVKWIGEGFSRSTTALEPNALGSSIDLYFGFPEVGTYSIDLEFIGTNEKVVKKQLKFNVTRGNTVQITKIEVQKFYDQGKTWDPEFSENDPKRLADLVFALRKTMNIGFNKQESSVATWFISEVHENESSLTWDLSAENLYLNPLARLEFALEDLDEGNMAQNLLLDYPTRPVDLRPYMAERPASIVLKIESIDLEVTFFLDWP